MVYDGYGQSEPEFEKQVEDSLGEFETTNLWLVDKLRVKLGHNNHLIMQLQNDLRQTEVIFKEKINSQLTQVRENFDQEIKQLKEKLKVSLQVYHLSRNIISQRDSFISQLQDRITTIESTIIDNEGLQIVQQHFYETLDIIQKHYHVINNSLQIIADKEK